MNVIPTNSKQLLDHEAFEKRIKERKQKLWVMKITRIIFFLVIWGIIGTYFLSPIGRVSISTLAGNYYYSKDDIFHEAKLKKGSLMLSVDTNQLENRLNANPRIKNAVVLWRPDSLKIKINEIVPIARDEHGIILTNGEYYQEYFERHPDYSLDPIARNLHVAQFVNSIFKADLRQIEFVESLKLIAVDLFAKIDYLDITRLLNEETALYFGIYLKLDNNDYMRIRMKSELFDEIFKTNFLNKIMNQYSEFDKKTDLNSGITFYDATCSYNATTNSNTCLKLN